MAKSPKGITQLLMAWSQGDEEAIDEVVAGLYPNFGGSPGTISDARLGTRFNPLRWSMKPT
jgi:hypothetical protein